MLSAKIEFATGHETTAIKQLKSLLSESQEASDIADLKYELFRMTGENHFKTTALEEYQKLYEQTPKFEYKKRIEELTNTK